MRVGIIAVLWERRLHGRNLANEENFGRESGGKL
jgi:hypothetical protein